MGGSVGGALKKVGNVAKYANPIGYIGARGLYSGVTGSNPVRDVANDYFPGVGGQDNPYVAGPFSLDPNQVAGDKADILGLGNKQYSDTLAGIDEYGAAQTKRARDMFGQMLPDIAENSQAAHLYDSTGYGQEVARQQANIASQVAADEAAQRLAALNGRQGFESGALQRGLSLEDFINQANVAKTIGAQMAPQPATGKQNFGTVAQGVGAMAPWAKVGKSSGADNYYNALAKKVG
jgi:hypothetical protein